jgi:hypothetical protein
MTPPTRYALVTEEIVNAAYAWMGAHDVVLTDDALQGLITLLAASPNGGCVTAEKRYELFRIIHDNRDEGTQTGRIVDKILTALGLTVSGEG